MDPVHLPDCGLITYLHSKNLPYFARLNDLRNAVSAWLEYVPQTFPHYTRHTVVHSDEIIVQLSQLLFVDGDVQRPVVGLSAAEAYALTASAYLHDVGMVIADREKAEILGSDSWRLWTTGSGGGSKRWNAVCEFRNGDSPSDPAVRHFLADLQTRFLIAEFVRRVHHVRARQVLTEHHERLGNFAFGDQALLRTISDICVGHGLDTRDLEDPERYPDRRTVRGEQVNVRFIALLLRLGDLLDMSSSRACPLLLSAASPLPADSLGHWRQYQRIIHRVTAPDRIEVTAECETQEEHRLLQDWCTWLVNEATAAQLLMSHASRHEGWSAPVTRIDPPMPTVRIRPAPHATYKPSRWVFELDVPSVLDRLISDVYKFPLSFVRELLQNAFDANRTQMYSDMKQQNIPLPHWPSHAPPSWRDRYPVNVTLSEITIINELSGEAENRQVVTVDDSGIGMDSDIVERFLLQIGRSYYTSDEFRDAYPFVPTSQFGIGFLSVFGVSDRVDVETFRPTSRTADGPLLLTLTGPRAYLLTSRGSRTRHGTSVSVQLRERIDSAHFADLVTFWCRRVEFPIHVRVYDTEERVITAEIEREYRYDQIGGQSRGKAAFVPHAVRTEMLEGEIYIPTYVTGAGESWSERGRIGKIAETYPLGDEVLIPSTLVCHHGINVADVNPVMLSVGRPADNSLIARVDVRGLGFTLPLSRRGSFDLRDSRELMLQLEPKYEELLNRHLADPNRIRSSDDWVYKQQLAKEFPLPTYWRDIDGMIPAVRAGEATFMSLREAQELEEISITFGPDTLFRSSQSIKRTARAESIQALAWQEPSPIIISNDLGRFADIIKTRLLQNRELSMCVLPHRGIPIATFSLPGKGLAAFDDSSQPVHRLYVIDLKHEGLFALVLRRNYFHFAPIVLNASHPFTKWMVAVKGESLSPERRVSAAQFRRMVDVVRHAVLSYYGDALESMNTFFRVWRENRLLPEELLPPDREILAAEVQSDR